VLEKKPAAWNVARRSRFPHRHPGAGRDPVAISLDCRCSAWRRLSNVATAMRRGRYWVPACAGMTASYGAF